MRGYIFTPRERRIVEAWLQGKRVEEKPLSVILARIRHFNQLPSDVELYLKARAKAGAKPSST